MAVTFYPNNIHYAGFDAAAEPTITGETYTSSGGETSGAVYDLVDNRETNKVTIDTNAAATTIPIRLDVTSSLSCDFAIIGNHNLNTSGALFDIEQGGANVTLTASYSGTLGSETAADAAAGTPDADGVTLVTFSSVADTQWEIELDSSDGNYDADATIGEIAFGASKAPSFNPELQPLFGYDMPGSSYNESDGGQRYGFSTHTDERRSWRMTWKYMSDVDKKKLEDVFLWTRGVKFPFYIDLGPVLRATNPQLYYVRFVRPLSFTGLTADAWQVTIDIEEEI